MTEVILFISLGFLFLTIILILFVITLIRRNQIKNNEIYEELKRLKETIEKNLNYEENDSHL